MTKTLSEFYDGKSIFITGAAGYIGTVLLEILLRCFPGIKGIYILLRPKKNMSLLNRKETIFKKPIMTSVLKTNPEVFNKVHVVSGDVSLPNLGMNDDELDRICREASIVFHCAALISFLKPYRDIALDNSQGTYNIVKLCKKLKQLDALVYTSTAYSNSHRYREKIEEKIYSMPYPAQRYLDELENGSTESFDELVWACDIRWPNSYTFSKCLAENILKEKAANLPIAIIRPSIVFCTKKGSLPGYIEPGTAMIDLSIAVGRGFVKVVRANKNAIVDVIPADVAVNSHVVTAWSVATGKLPSLTVVNCTSGDIYRLTYDDYLKSGIELVLKYPIKKTLQTMSLEQVENKYVFHLLKIYKHYLPATILDIYFHFKGSNFRLVKLYKIFDEIMKSFYFFASRTFDFDTNNFKRLSKDLSADEKEMIYTDLGGTFNEVMDNLPFGYDVFYVKPDEKSQQRRHAVFVRSMLIEVIKKVSLFLLFYFIYLFVVKVIF